jgi:AAA domain
VATTGSIDAGGAFSLPVKDRGDLVPQLTDVRRFVADWERNASLRLRGGDDAVLDDYETNGRIAGGTRTEMIAAVYDAWRADVDAGKSSLMIGADGGTVTELNRLASRSNHHRRRL